MVGTPHGLLGALAGERAAGGGGAFLAGVASHLAADRVPHRDYPLCGAGGKLAACADVALLVVLVRRASIGRRGWAGVAGALVPDVLEQALGGRDAFSRFVHGPCHNDREPRPLVALGVQAAVAAVAYALLQGRGSRIGTFHGSCRGRRRGFLVRLRRLSTGD